MGTSALTRDMVNAAVPGGALVAPSSSLVGILPPELWTLPKEPHFQPFPALALTVGAPQAPAFRADPAFDFVFFMAMARARDVTNATVVLNPPVTVDMQLSNAGTGFNPAGQPNDADNVFGTASQPAILGVPLIVRGGDTLTMTLTLLAGAAINFRAALVGFRAQRTRR